MLNTYEHLNVCDWNFSSFSFFFLLNPSLERKPTSLFQFLMYILKPYVNTKKCQTCRNSKLVHPSQLSDDTSSSIMLVFSRLCRNHLKHNIFCTPSQHEKDQSVCNVQCKYTTGSINTLFATSRMHLTNYTANHQQHTQTLKPSVMS